MSGQGGERPEEEELGRHPVGGGLSLIYVAKGHYDPLRIVAGVGEGGGGTSSFGEDHPSPEERRRSLGLEQQPPRRRGVAGVETPGRLRRQARAGHELRLQVCFHQILPKTSISFHLCCN